MDTQSAVVRDQIAFGPDYKVLRGGSWATRPHAIRNWYYPIRRQLYCGFRCAR
jgi:iron(II)-dependent oxidoreductase